MANALYPSYKALLLGAGLVCERLYDSLKVPS